MSDPIKLVQGDTRPQLIFTLYDEQTNDPLDVSDGDTAVRLHFRARGEETPKATLTCGKLAGLLLPDGSNDLSVPYNVPGKGGRVFLDWLPDTLDTAGEFEGEIEVTFGDGSTQTVFDALRFKVRPQIG